MSGPRGELPAGIDSDGPPLALQLQQLPLDPLHGERISWDSNQTVAGLEVVLRSEGCRVLNYILHVVLGFEFDGCIVDSMTL